MSLKIAVNLLFVTIIIQSQAFATIGPGPSPGPGPRPKKGTMVCGWSIQSKNTACAEVEDENVPGRWFWTIVCQRTCQMNHIPDLLKGCNPPWGANCPAGNPVVDYILPFEGDPEEFAGEEDCVSEMNNGQYNHFCVDITDCDDVPPKTYVYDCETQALASLLPRCEGRFLAIGHAKLTI